MRVNKDKRAYQMEPIDGAIETALTFQEIGIIGLLFLIVLALAYIAYQLYKERDQCKDNALVTHEQFTKIQLDTKDHIIEIKENHHSAVSDLKVELATVKTEMNTRKTEQELFLQNMRDLQLSVLEKASKQNGNNSA